MLSKVSGAAYDPEAPTGRWERFVSEVMQGDGEKAAFIQKALGYALTGDTRHTGCKAGPRCGSFAVFGWISDEENACRLKRDVNPAAQSHQIPPAWGFLQVPKVASKMDG